MVRRVLVESFGNYSSKECSLAVSLVGVSVGVSLSKLHLGEKLPKVAASLPCCPPAAFSG